MASAGAIDKGIYPYTFTDTGGAWEVGEAGVGWGKVCVGGD